jgi:hypothetical protein
MRGDTIALAKGAVLLGLTIAAMSGAWSINGYYTTAKWLWIVGLCVTLSAFVTWVSGLYFT